MGLSPEALREPAATLRAEAAAAGLPAPEIAVLTALPLADVSAARTQVAAYRDAGATRLIHGGRYEDVGAFRRTLDEITRIA